MYINYINYTITENNLHIIDSYKISKKEMEDFLCQIQKDSANLYIFSKIWSRPFFSLRMEWVCHNFLYSIGYKREQTKDVDLNLPCKIEWLYKVLGCLVWVFVK